MSIAMKVTPEMAMKITGFEFDKNFVSIDTSVTD